MDQGSDSVKGSFLCSWLGKSQTWHKTTSHETLPTTAMNLRNMITYLAGSDSASKGHIRRAWTRSPAVYLLHLELRNVDTTKSYDGSFNIDYMVWKHYFYSPEITSMSSITSISYPFPCIDFVTRTVLTSVAWEVRWFEQTKNERSEMFSWVFPRPGHGHAPKMKVDTLCRLFSSLSFNRRILETRNWIGRKKSWLFFISNLGTPKYLWELQ